VDALYRVQLEWDRRRDFFPAYLIALQMKDTSPDDVLNWQYPAQKKDAPLFDTIDGAQGGEELRARLEGRDGNSPSS
jgi:hypothetical protein